MEKPQAFEALLTSSWGIAIKKKNKKKRNAQCNKVLYQSFVGLVRTALLLVSHNNLVPLSRFKKCTDLCKVTGKLVPRPFRVLRGFNSSLRLLIVEVNRLSSHEIELRVLRDTIENNWQRDRYWSKNSCIQHSITRQGLKMELGHMVIMDEQRMVRQVLLNCVKPKSESIFDDLIDPDGKRCNQSREWQDRLGKVLVLEMPLVIWGINGE